MPYLLHHSETHCSCNPVSWRRRYCQILVFHLPTSPLLALVSSLCSPHQGLPGLPSSWCPWMVSEQGTWKITVATFLSSTSCVSHQPALTLQLFMVLNLSGVPGVTGLYCVAGNTGTTTAYMRPAYPTKTFPNHYSIVTVSVFGLFRWTQRLMLFYCSKTPNALFKILL